jgi:ankyrin repeat protein
LGNTPLMMAAKAGAVINIKTLITLRATPTKFNSKGLSALHIAA